MLVLSMKGRAARGAWEAAGAQQPRPRDRYKHACAACRGFVYLYGGRGSTTLSDFWRYHTVKNEWEMLDCSRDGPEELEEHSMVAYKGSLYIFGGMVDSAFTQAKTPLWIYDIVIRGNLLEERKASEYILKEKASYYSQYLPVEIGNELFNIDSARWTESCNEPAETESSAPANRKGHSAVVYHSSMYIYGGYFGIKGISQEFWEFHFDTRKWLCVSSPCHSSGPGARHGHSAVVYHTAMYLFGGLMGLTEQRDLWRWDFGSSSWSSIRTSQGPPPLVGHASIVCKDSMLIFGGGISNSSPNDDLWKYHFHTQTWKKLSSTTKGNFSPKMYHCILGIGADFQTTSDFIDTFPTHCESEQKDHPQLVPIPRHFGFCSYFCPQTTERSNAIEMKTFSLPLEPAEFPAFQTTSEAGLGPNRDRSCLSKDKSLHLLACSGEALAAAQALGEEERTSCGCAATGGESSCTNTLLLIGGKPLSSFSDISFRQMEFDCL
ncbi:leucine-zipper-like transcriptional regulator 1 homolog isoform X1 [Poecile atricapillus]|uniref:leucine-zipper-like transcriptional regulator 1 homolog isoform X1 n=2 Tax=Poecile atricapillus TaxID=48891 RepID=UPI0027383AAC|nr:leucine-zipper-like transcriptional regulator 1 homolog isoform X1 [Poecile atricapillus]XP_058695303.1 leucine-zipper-like transcriptional regulator 1 homolog isoform X1 [Poecile atricapillus]